MEHGHGRREVADEVDVVLDHDGREMQAPGKIADELARGVGLLGRHAGRGLVEQDQLGPVGEQQRDLQPLPLAVREVAGRSPRLRLQPDECQHLTDAAARSSCRAT